MFLMKLKSEINQQFKIKVSNTMQYKDTLMQGLYPEEHVHEIVRVFVFCS